MGQKTFTKKLNTTQKAELTNALMKSGWNQSNKLGKYVESRFETAGGVVQIYQTGKMVAQVSDIEKEKVKAVSNYFEGQIELFDESKKDGKTLKMLLDKSRIGCDEAGKGEYFGPLVAVACFVDAKSVKRFIDIGVKDSKMLTDPTIKEIARKLGEETIYASATSMCSDGNMSEILATLHFQAIKEVFEKCRAKNIPVEAVVVDKFSSKTERLSDKYSKISGGVELFQIEKGERDIAVACASILARSNYLEKLAEIEEKYGVDLPRGYNEKMMDFSRNFIAKWVWLKVLV